uniref:Nudix hydrolase domain-containing protein n=1 Tax=Clastoptera arizonana TaxID=38151 RepID=A0A1B6EB63_9HEMI
MKKWKDASSLIVMVANITSKTDLKKPNFHLLKLRKKSEYFPKISVFPGGSVSPADYSSEWIHIFQGGDCKFGSNQTSDKNLSSVDDYDMPKSIFLKITAIRETFEECGLLLCKYNNNKLNEPFAQHFQIESIDFWRNKVINDPFQFINLCKEFKCYPNIEVIYPWSNWLTPRHIPKKFDAKFFITTLVNKEPVTPDNIEIESCGVNI